MLRRTLTWGAAAIAVAGGVAATPPSPAEARFGDKVLRKGSHGRDVRVLQRWLTLVGHRTKVDGHFGRRTVSALRRYERAAGLRVDGRLSRTEAERLRQDAYAARARAAASEQGLRTTAGAQATLSDDGRTAIAPASAPPEVKAAIEAANAIAGKPYKYGGGHGRFEDSGYDCSGAVSYVLRAAAGLETPLDSSGLMSYGEPGKGEWITVYAHGSHAYVVMYVVIAGLRFDTSGRGGKGPRWRTEERSGRGYRVRHPAGL